MFNTKISNEDSQCARSGSGGHGKRLRDRNSLPEGGLESRTLHELIETEPKTITLFAATFCRACVFGRVCDENN